MTVSTFRLIIGFLLSFNVTTWIDSMGFFGAFTIYSGVIAAVALVLPLIFLYGKRIRHWTAGRLERAENSSKVKLTDEDPEPEGRDDIELKPTTTAYHRTMHTARASLGTASLHSAPNDHNELVDLNGEHEHTTRVDRAY